MSSDSGPNEDRQGETAGEVSWSIPRSSPGARIHPDLQSAISNAMAESQATVLAQVQEMINQLRPNRVA